ncbi:MAG: butirosin biosynthesis protein BtrN [Halobacteriovorax sp.]|nr:butirosin biosynthesis protein BtrN [Halobacteriovorax sp.]|tara:strand:- start:72820 stop:73590 length:771 start_codon:yes stop_codon:yes gene_type:complete
MAESQVNLTSLELGLFSEIEFEISHKCNMACSYCPNSQYERIEQGEMSLELFEKVMKELKEAGFSGRVSYHFYNEPMLSKNLDKFIELTTRYLPNSSPYLFSNGTLLTKKRFDELKSLGVKKFHITKHEDVKTNYVFDKTYEEISPEDKAELVYFEDYTQVELSNRQGLLSHIAPVEKSWLPCFIPLRLVVITLEGNVLPCYDDYLQKLEMGNVNENSIIEIWNSDKYKTFREDLRQKKGREKYKTCKGCSNFKIN